MTDLTAYTPPPTEIITIDPTGGRLVAWAEAASAANSLARALSATAFVPAAMKNPGDATAAILMGDELGLSPLAALRSIYVVHGTPALYAKAMVAVAQAHGHQIWTEETSDAKVVVCGQRRGTDKVERAEWTIARAQKAGYTSNKKYGTNPQEMLYSKAAGEIARKIAADALAAMPYSVEDLELEDTPTTTVTRETATAKTTVRRRPKAEQQPEPGPSVDEPKDEDEPTPATGEQITDAQSTHLHALITDLGLNREQKLAGLSRILSRDITSSKELTKDEASAVIESLKIRLAQQDTDG